MSEPDFEFIVIGGGSAGYAGASTAACLGLKTAVIEGGKQIGGLCILRGCMPSKTLLESGHRAEAIRRAGEFGLRAQYLGADGAAIRARKRKLINLFADHRTEQLQSGRFEFIRGGAAFIDPHTIEVKLLEGGTRQLTAHAFLIATGSRLQWHEVLGLRETGFLTSDDVLDSEHIPASVVVLGGGAIALELASFYAGIGSRVSVIQRSELVLKETDADVAQANGHRSAGSARDRDSPPHEAAPRRGRGGRQAHLLHPRWRRAFHRGGGNPLRPRPRGPPRRRSQLARAGVATNGLAKQSSPTCISAAAPSMSMPPAMCAARLRSSTSPSCKPSSPPAMRPAPCTGSMARSRKATTASPSLRSSPSRQVAAVGFTEREAREKHDILVAKYPFHDHGKALIHGSTHGFVKLIAERTSRRILGASCVGPDASELIHEIAVAMHFNATAGDLARIPHYHPTLSEIWTYPAEELAGITEPHA